MAAEGDAGFADGAIAHCTEIGGTAVAGLWNAFGAWADIADAVSHRHPEAWIVGYERGAGLDAALAAGFTAVGPLPRLESEPRAPLTIRASQTADLFDRLFHRGRVSIDPYRPICAYHRRLSCAPVCIDTEAVKVLWGDTLQRASGGPATINF